MGDCPGPIIMETKSKPEIDLNNLSFIEKECKGIDNNLYNIKIYNTKDSIIFHLKKLNDFYEIIYKQNYTLEELNNINIYFKSFYSIEDIYNDFFKNYEENKIIIFENEDKIHLKFKYIHGTKEKEIEFIFDSYDLNIRKVLFKLYDKIIEIDKLQLEINEINNKLNEQKIINENNKKELNENMIKELNKTNKKLEEQTKGLFKNKYFIFIILFVIIINIFYNISHYKSSDIDNQFKSNNNKINDIYYNFTLIYNKINDIDKQLKPINNKLDDYIDIIFKNDNIIILPSLSFFIKYDINKFYIFISLINEGIKNRFNKKIKSFKKIYQASIDGCYNEVFHRKCNGKNFTITLVITDKDKIFGGFTENEWNQDEKTIKGYKGFIFSINNNKIYYTKNGYYKIYRSQSYGPYFVGGFRISNKNGIDSTYNYSEFNLEGKEYVLTGELDYSIKDYVVYQIELE